MKRPFSKVLIANRGEIAVRVMRTCRDLGIRTVAVYSEADRGAPFVVMADESVAIGPAPARESYLVIDRILEAASATGAEAVHPGYGFLSENAGFADACVKAGLVFVGPPADAMRRMGSKLGAREIMASSGVPVVPGSGRLASAAEALAVAREVGFPVMLKASGGGGGIGMRAVGDEAALEAALESAINTAQNAFGDGTVYLEKLVSRPRHIEVQVLADSHGNAVHLGERECSVQRRHQKVVEETPSPVVTEELRRRMGEAAVRAAQASGYVNAGTVEFIFSEGDFYFLEMNTRLQVEHPVTEMVTGLDLVELQLRVAAGERLPFTQEEIVPRGHAFEFRIYAEDPAKRFLPSPGRVRRLHFPAGPGVRVDAGVIEGSEVSQHYDPMIAKLVVWGEDRAQSARRSARALAETIINGPGHNVALHRALLEDRDFLQGNLTTAFLDEHPGVLERARELASEPNPLAALAGGGSQVAAIAGVAAFIEAERTGRAGG
ncbi:MAG: acetyl-CoA carboxylase biotin carboxylase subunit [Candidatus Dormibacteria bacterium]